MIFHLFFKLFLRHPKIIITMKKTEKNEYGIRKKQNVKRNDKKSGKIFLEIKTDPKKGY